MIDYTRRCTYCIHQETYRSFVDCKHKQVDGFVWASEHCCDLFERSQRDIYCTRTGNITCPYCACEIPYHGSGYGDDGDVDEYECDNCGNTFFAETHIDVTFSSRKTEEEE